MIGRSLLVLTNGSNSFAAKIVLQELGTFSLFVESNRTKAHCTLPRAGSEFDVKQRSCSKGMINKGATCIPATIDATLESRVSEMTLRRPSTHLDLNGTDQYTEIVVRPQADFSLADDDVRANISFHSSGRDKRWLNISTFTQLDSGANLRSELRAHLVFDIAGVEDSTSLGATVTVRGFLQNIPLKVASVEVRLHMHTAA